MKSETAARIPEEGCRIVLGDGPDGEVWVDLALVRDDDAHRNTNRIAFLAGRLNQSMRQPESSPMARASASRRTPGRSPTRARVGTV